MNSVLCFVYHLRRGNVQVIAHDVILLLSHVFEDTDDSFMKAIAQLPTRALRKSSLKVSFFSAEFNLLKQFVVYTYIHNFFLSCVMFWM
jgi:hypothetical protein